MAETRGAAEHWEPYPPMKQTRRRWRTLIIAILAFASSNVARAADDASTAIRARSARREQCPAGGRCASRRSSALPKRPRIRRAPLDIAARQTLAYAADVSDEIAGRNYRGGLQPDAKLAIAGAEDGTVRVVDVAVASEHIAPLHDERQVRACWRGFGEPEGCPVRRPGSRSES